MRTSDGSLLQEQKKKQKQKQNKYVFLSVKPTNEKGKHGLLG